MIDSDLAATIIRWWDKLTWEEKIQIYQQKTTNYFNPLDHEQSK